MRVSLEELLGNHQPPDLSDRILETLNETREENDSRTAVMVETAMKEPAGSSPVVAPRSLETSMLNRPRDVRRWTGIIASLSLVIFAVLSVVVLMAIRESFKSDQLATPTPKPSEQRSEPLISQPPQHTTEDSRLAESKPTIPDGPDTATSPATPNTPLPTPQVESLPSGSEPLLAETPWQDRDTLSTEFVVTRLNQEFKDRWKNSGIKPAEEVGDLAWADRVFQFILGRSMEDSEQTRLESRVPLSRPRVVNELLYGDDYRDEFTRHWATLLGNYLLSKKLARNEPLISPDAFIGHLQEQLSLDRGLDKIAMSLVTATGNVTPGQPDFNPATSFLVSINDARGVSATESTVQLLWGEKVRCARCHDPESSSQISQDGFWRINAHFRQLMMRGNQESGVELRNVDFSGELQDPSRAAIFYENGGKSLIAAFPQFSEGEAWPQSGRVDEFDRRSALARALVRDKRFPETMVNWVWTEAFGFPLMSGPATNDPTNKANHHTLNELALDFAAHDFQLASLLYWIALSGPMSLDTSPDNDLVADAPWLGTPALFSFFYEYEPRFVSVQQGLASMDKAFQQGPQAVLALRDGFQSSAPSNRSPQGTAQADASPQAGLNWRLVQNNWLTTNEMAEVLHRIVVSPLTVDEKIQHVFLMATHRAPTRGQARLVKKWLEQEVNNPISVYQDLWWTLSNSEQNSNR